jgi:hypothetical protein
MTPRTRGILPLVAALGVGATAAACARQGAPPGGPQDRRPPVVVRVSPDTFATVEPGGEAIRIDFDERISERPAQGALAGAVRVSPRTGPVRVSHGRRGLEVTVGGGFRPGLVYRVRVEPVLNDMFGNRMRAPFEWVFSTGGEFQENAVGGLVWDRVTGEPVQDVQVLLRRGEAEDPGFDTVPPHVALTDSGGIFALRYLPEGSYTVTAFQDRNANDEPDAFEMQGTSGELAVASSDTVVTSFSIMIPDTTAPRVVRVETVDSATLRVTMDDPIAPEAPLRGTVPGIYREEGDAPAVVGVLHEREWTELRDSLAAARPDPAAAADTAAVPGVPVPAQPADSLEVDTVPALPSLLPPEGGPPAGAGVGPQRTMLPDGTPVPSRSLVVRLSGPLEPGRPYTVRVQGVTNLVGLVSEQQESVVTRPAPVAAPPADTASVDTMAVPPDTNRVRLRPPSRR